MDVQLDVGALVGSLAWPAVLLAVLWWYRDPLSELFRELPRRIKSVAVAGFSMELADAAVTSLASLQVSVDLRHAGTPSDVNDSTLRSFYDQIRDATRIDYAVIDLGTGGEWLSSRLYILSIILQRMRGLRAFVFVETVEQTHRRFVGVCNVEPLRWRLAARWPRLESAAAAAELQLWGHPYDTRGGQIPDLPALANEQAPHFRQFSPPVNGSAHIVNAEGRIVGWEDDPQPAADLLRYFLDAIQREPQPCPDPEWVSLPLSDPPLEEHAVWLVTGLLDEILGESLQRPSVARADLQGWSRDVRLRAFLEQSGDWVAVVREEGVFDRLIDRRQILERVGSEVVSGL